MTHVLDKGLPAVDLPGRLAAADQYIDIWKFGWGTAYLDPGVASKLALLAAHGVRACVGGTLLEVAWSQDKVVEFLAWAAELGFPCVEVSRGAVAMPLEEKRDLIRLARAAGPGWPGFTVLTEVGAKDPAAPAVPEEWVSEVAGDLAAGAALVLTEGRESGTVGLFRADGSVRSDLVEALVEAVGLSRLMFEAPRKDQQAWLINRFGPEVNLANVALDETLGLEALRLGLRADTLDPVAQLPRLRPLTRQGPTVTATINRVPRQYREVSVTAVDFPLTAERVSDYLLGREVYKRTRLRRCSVAARDTAVAEVASAPGDGMMAVVTDVSVLALPPQCRFVTAPEVDTGIPARWPGRPESWRPECPPWWWRAATTTSTSSSTRRRGWCGWSTWCPRGRPSCWTRRRGCSRSPRSCRPWSWWATSSTWLTWLTWLTGPAPSGPTLTGPAAMRRPGTCSRAGGRASRGTWPFSTNGPPARTGR